MVRRVDAVPRVGRLVKPRPIANRPVPSDARIHCPKPAFVSEFRPHRHIGLLAFMTRLQDRDSIPHTSDCATWRALESTPRRRRHARSQGGSDLDH